MSAHGVSPRVARRERNKPRRGDRKMLDLSSPRWSELSHAYGSAADIPNLLRQLETAPPQDNYQSEPWYSIWSALCHQGDVYTATYAAIPVIIAMARKRGDRERFDFLNFIGYAEACRHHKRAPSVPSDLEHGYVEALNDAADLFVASLKQEWKEEEMKALLGGLAAVRGYSKLGEVIIELDSGLLCPECECDLSGGVF